MLSMTKNWCQLNCVHYDHKRLKLSVTYLNFCKSWEQPGRGERRRGKSGKFYFEKIYRILTMHNAQCTMHTKCTGNKLSFPGCYENSRGRFRRCCLTGSTTPTLHSLSCSAPAMSSWTMYGRCSKRTGWSSLMSSRSGTLFGLVSLNVFGLVSLNVR